MKAKTPMSVSNIVDLAGLKRYASQMFDAILLVINGNISFGDNIQSTTLPVDFNKANTDIQVGHNLGRAPNGYIVVGRSASMTVYDGAQAADADNLYLRSSATGTARILVF